MSEKVKKGQPKRNKFVFLLLWLIGHVLAWTVFIPVVEIFDSAFINDLSIYIAIALIIGGITSLTQYLLIRRQFGRNIKSWIPISVITSFLSMLLIFPFVENYDSSQIGIMLQALVIFTPAAIVQTFLLRKHVRQAWLWALASIAGSSTFAMPIAYGYGDEWAVLVGYGLYASATALTLIWLFGMSGTQITKKAIDTSKLIDTDEENDIDERQYLSETEAQGKMLK